MKIAIAAFVIALLSGMGVGSGGLLVIYLTLVEKVDQLTAQGINLLFFIFSAASSLLLHITRRRLYAGVILILSLCGIVGSLLGSTVAAKLPSPILSKMFGIMLTVSGILSLRKKPEKAKGETEEKQNRP